jgi:Sulfotransferase family
VNINADTLLSPVARAILLSSVAHVINRIDQTCQTTIQARLMALETGFHSTSYRFSKDKIAFIHIPKTGGTSISEMLAQQDDGSRFANLHMHRPVSKYCPPQEYQYITMLRHPVNRIFSYWRMVNRDKFSPYAHLCPRGLEHFINHCWEARNVCCRYLAGEINPEVNEETYERACNNLLNFRFVGLFDQFETSIAQLLMLLGSGKTELIHRRQSPDSQPSQTEYSIIEKYNEYDIRLYEFYLHQLESG